MKRVLLVLLVLLVLAMPASSWAASFVYDAGAAAPTGKSDYQVNPNIPSNQKLVAAEVNQIGQNEYDLRDGITHGYYWGLASQIAAPPAPSDGVMCFNMQDGGAIYCQYPDAGAWQLGGGLKLTLPGALYSPGQVDIDGGLTTTTLASSSKATLDSAYVPGIFGVDAGAIVDNLYAKGPLVSDAGITARGDANISGNTITNSVHTDLITATGLNIGVNLNGDTANGSGSGIPGIVLNNDQALSTAGDKLLSVRNNGVEKQYFDFSGNEWLAGWAKVDGGQPVATQVSVNEFVSGTVGNGNSPKVAAVWIAPAGTGSTISEAHFMQNGAGSTAGNVYLTVTDVSGSGIICQFDAGGCNTGNPLTDMAPCDGLSLTPSHVYELTMSANGCTTYPNEFVGMEVTHK